MPTRGIIRFSRMPGSPNRSPFFAIATEKSPPQNAAGSFRISKRAALSAGNYEPPARPAPPNQPVLQENKSPWPHTYAVPPGVSLSASKECSLAVTRSGRYREAKWLFGMTY
jgi:hypothetical protein